MDVIIWSTSSTRNSKRISKINDLRTHVLHHIDEFTELADDFIEYWLTEETECIKKIVYDLWKHSEMLNELIRNTNSEIKTAQDEWRSCKDSTVSTMEETVELEPVMSETVIEIESSDEVECPECWWTWPETDKCPECDYVFNS